jgi:hypothetical protein
MNAASAAKFPVRSGRLSAFTSRRTFPAFDCKMTSGCSDFARSTLSTDISYRTFVPPCPLFYVDSHRPRGALRGSSSFTGLLRKKARGPCSWDRRNLRARHDGFQAASSLRTAAAELPNLSTAFEVAPYSRRVPWSNFLTYDN